MFELSVIREGNLVYSYSSVEKDIKNYAKTLENKKADIKVMKTMQNKFLNLMNSDKQVKTLYTIATATGIAVMNTTLTYAADLGNVSDKIREVTKPVIELLAGLGYPLTYGMLITGALMIVTGRKSKGLEVIKWAALGYLGLQFVPFLLGLLEMIGRELRNSL